MVDIMDKVKKLVLMSFIVLFWLIFSWTIDPKVAIIFGSFAIVTLLGVLFEIKNYYNKNIYLAISAFILILGLILECIYVFKLNYIDTHKVIFFILAGIVAGSIFGTALIRANSWEKTKIEMKT